MALSVFIAVVVIAVSGLIAIGMLSLFGLGAFVAVRRARAPVAAPPAPKTAAPPPPPWTGETRLPTSPIAVAPSATPIPAPGPPARGAPDAWARVLDDPSERDAAKTELFQRGASAFGFDPDSDAEEPEEGGATEIFSAHGPAGDLADLLSPGLTTRREGRN